MKISNLVLSGGGYNTFTILGALDVLHEAGALDSLECLAGASAGAIMSVLLALGFAPREICDLEESLMHNCLQFNDLGSFTSTGCPLTFHPLKTALSKLMDRFPDIETLADLLHKMGKNVTIVATRIMSGEPEYFDAYSAVQYPIVDLLLASASLPMLFEPTKLGGSAYWDGGLTDPLPIQLFPPEETLAVNLSYDSTSRASPLVHLSRICTESTTRLKLSYLTTYTIITVEKPESSSSIVNCNTSDKLKMFLSGQTQMRDSKSTYVA